MLEENIFAAAPAAPVVPVVAPVISSIPQDLIELVGEGKKYKSVEEALKSVPFAQGHIKTLTEELAAVKLELDKRKTAEQILDEIKTRQDPIVSPQATNGVSAEEVSAMVEKALTSKQNQQTADTNISKVIAQFAAKFGDTAEATYVALAKEAGLSIQMMNQLAATSPTAVLKLAGLDTKVVPVGKPSSSINTGALKPIDPNTEPSARVRQGASTKEMVAAWKIAGQKVNKQT